MKTKRKMKVKAVVVQMLESNFYCNCTSGNRGSIRSFDDCEICCPDDGAMGYGHGMKACWDREGIGNVRVVGNIRSKEKRKFVAKKRAGLDTRLT